MTTMSNRINHMTQSQLPCSLLRNRRRFIHYRYLSVALFALVTSPSVTKSFSTSFPRSFATTVVSSSTQRQQQSLNKFHLTTGSNDEHQRFPVTTALSYRGGDATNSRIKSTVVRSASTLTDLEVQTKEKEEFNMSTLSPEEKLTALRLKMKELHLDVYIIPTDDPHLSEYVPQAYMRRAFLTGFTGSAGTAVVTHDKALLWTDSRYWNEAGIQLDANHWTMQKSGSSSVPSIQKWLAECAVEKYKNDQSPLQIGLDPFVHPASFVKDIESSVKEVSASEMFEKNTVLYEVVTQHENIVDPIWGEDRPPIPTSPFRVHPMEYAGKSVAQKLTKIRAEMTKKHATMSVFSTLDDVAYLFNVRAKGDIDTCPVGIAYATVTNEKCTLYCDPQKLVDNAVVDHLKENEVVCSPYDNIIADIQAHLDTTTDSTPKIWLDKARSNLALVSVIPELSLIDTQNSITPMKAAKNEAELNGMREAHIVDGAAMANFMAWLEDKIVNKKESVDEVEIDEVLTGYRAEQPGFVECSFPTIAGVGPNGAIIHYRAKRDEIMRNLDRTVPILIDSGGQYMYGTTDVTRTWSFQETPDPQFKEYFTRVLKGHIGVDQMIFPENTPGFVLDVFARRWLWNIGKDYGHGTGHGVGAALNVHEGPMSISPRFTNTEGLKRGMVVSNEPGYYEDGNFGIRIENLLEIQYVNPEDYVPDDDEATNGSTGGAKGSDAKKFLKFGRLTQIPIQKNLIDRNIMTESELDWIDSYHAEVLSKVGPRLPPHSPAMKWLQKSCEKLER